MKYPLQALAFTLAAILPGPSIVAAAPSPRLLVGPHPRGGFVVPTAQIVRPAGNTLSFGGRPTDVVLSPDGRTLFAKDNRGLVVVDAASWKLRQEIGFPEGGGSMHGLVVSRDGSRLYAATAQNALWEAIISRDGVVSWGRKFVLPGPDGKTETPACLWGIALSTDGKTAYVCLSRNNTLAVLDLGTGKVIRQIPVGVAPYDVVLDSAGRIAYVSNWGGRHPGKGELTAPSSGTQALVDERGVGSSGTVSVVDLIQGTELAQIRIGLHPSDIKLSADGRNLFVANANSDTVSIIDTRTRTVTGTVPVRPSASLPFGSAPNGLTLSRDGATLFVANGGNNALAAISISGKANRKGAVRGFIPTAWYPSAVTNDGRYLYVACVKGYGARNGKQDARKWEIYQHLGTLSRIAIPSPAALKGYTAQVRSNARLSPPPPAARTGRRAVPVPAVPGAPSVFRHVVYVIKENKTFDQYFGDLKQANSDPSLCVFGREVTPNHHALAEQFALLDNFYCNGVCSADGHSWCVEGNVTDYLEKSFGGFTRSYPFGDDSLNTSSSGQIWDNVLSHGRTFRNYGEMDYAEPANGESWKTIYADFLTGDPKIRYKQNIGVDRLRHYSCRDYPGWNLGIPDVVRANVFLKELAGYNATGTFPDFTIVYLPNDHTSGGSPGVPTPRAQVADNDLALGRVVEGITKSRFWPNTCVFVIEDDPQSGYDHVDGHRSICLVVSPYTKRGVVLSEFYNQTSVLRTMERILGLPPMTQMDAGSPLMTECFTSKPNLTPYVCLPNRIPLDEMTSPTASFYGKGRYLASGGRENPFARPDQIDDDELNRAIWHSVKGYAAPYPAQFAGAHGKGLARLHLALDDPDSDEDEE